MNGDNTLAGSTSHNEVRTGLTNFDTARTPKQPPQISYLHVYQSNTIDRYNQLSDPNGNSWKLRIVYGRIPVN
jgi:hypothetical protein